MSIFSEIPCNIMKKYYFDNSIKILKPIIYMTLYKLLGMLTGCPYRGACESFQDGPDFEEERENLMAFCMTSSHRECGCYQKMKKKQAIEYEYGFDIPIII